MRRVGVQQSRAEGIDSRRIDSSWTNPGWGDRPCASPPMGIQSVPPRHVAISQPAATVCKSLFRSLPRSQAEFGNEGNGERGTRAEGNRAVWGAGVPPKHSSTKSTKDHEPRRNGPRPWFLSDFRSSEPLRKPREALNRAHTGREQAICGFKGVGDFEGFHLLHQPYLLYRFQLAHKKLRCGAQMLLTTRTAKTSRKALKNIENGPKAVNLRVKSASSEWFFASKESLVRTKSPFGSPVVCTL